MPSPMQHTHLFENLPGSPSCATLDAGGHLLVLDARKCIWYAAQKTLIVADVHLGKSATFRRFGMPVPSGSSSESLARLSALVSEYDAQHLCILGDFLHGAEAHNPGTLQALSDWRARHAGLNITLVRGNHDSRAGDPPASARIEVVDEPHALAAGLLACHHPKTHVGAWVLAGHEHPCVHLKGPGHDRVRLPVFYAQAQCLVLPAFGAFTGMHPIAPGPDTHLWSVVQAHP